MKRLLHFLVYFLVGILSFIVFLYFSFPYEALKESISVKLASASGMQVEIGSIKPKLPLGISINKVDIFNQKNDNIKLKNITINLSVLYLLIANLGITIEAKQETGEITLFTKLGLFSLLKKKFIPYEINIKSKNFAIGQFVDFMLSNLAQSKSMNPFIKPMLNKMSANGSLTAQVDLKVPQGDLSLSSGNIDLEIKKGAILFDADTDIPNQQFSIAKIKSNITQGKLTVSNLSKLNSNNLNTQFSGTVIASDNIKKTKLAIKIQLKILGALKNQLGFIVNAITKKSSNGVININIDGTLGSGPTVSFN